MPGGIKMKDRKALLSTLWIFVTLNYLYCDLIGLMDPSTQKQILSGTLENGIVITQGFLLGSSILMEIPIAMVLLTWILRSGLSRWFNLIAGVIMTLVQIMSLFLGAPTIYYLFFSVIEIACTAFIVYYAWTWPKEAV